MVSRVSGAVPILTLKGEQIAQPGVIHRITQAIIFSNGHVALSSPLGETSCTIALPSGLSETALKEEYFPQVYWVAYQSLGKGEYRLTHNTRGLGAGNSVSTGKPGTKPLSGDVLKLYNDSYKQTFKKGDLDGFLLWLICEICQRNITAGKSTFRTYVSPCPDLLYSYDWIESVLKAGANPNTVNIVEKNNPYSGKSILELLCLHRSKPSAINAAQKLIEYGADLTICPNDCSLLEYFADSKVTCELILRMGKSKGIDVEAIDREAKAKRWRAKASHVYPDGQTALEKFLESSTADINEITGLFSGGADILKGYPLHAFFRRLNQPGYTINASDLGILDLLLSKKPNLNLPDTKGTYLLELACQHVVVFDRLIKAGADITNPAIAKAVFLASIKHKTHRVIHPHLNPRIPLEQGIHYAFQCNLLPFIQEAVSAGASVDYVDADHPETCLQFLCRNYSTYASSDSDRVTALKTLIDLKADDRKVDWDVYLKLPLETRKLFPELWRKEVSNRDEGYKKTADALAQKIIIGLSGSIYSQLDSAKLIDNLKQFISKIILSSGVDYLFSEENLLKRKSFVDLLIPALENLLNKKTYFDPNAKPPFLDLNTIESQIREKIQEWHTANMAEASKQHALSLEDSRRRQFEEQVKEQARKKEEEIAQLQAALLWKDRQDREQREKLEREIQEARGAAAYAADRARVAAEKAHDASLGRYVSP